MINRRASDAALRAEARGVLWALAEEGGADEAMEAYRALNRELEAAGVAPLPLPARMRRAEGKF